MREDYDDRDESKDARLTFLAERGLLADDEIAALLEDPGDPGLAPHARESAQRGADAVLGGLADRQEEAS